MDKERKKRGVIVAAWLAVSLLAGVLLAAGKANLLSRSKPQMAEQPSSRGLSQTGGRQAVLGDKNPRVNVSGRKEGYGTGGMIALASTDEPAVYLTGYDFSGKVAVAVYEADERGLLDYLTHDKEGQQIKKDLDISRFRLIKNLEHEVASAYGDGSKLLLPIGESGIYFLRVSHSSTHEDNFVVRSKIASLVKEGNNEYIFWAQDLQSRRSLGEGSLSLYNLEDSLKEVGSAAFSSEGIARTSLVADADVAIVRAQGEKAVVPINLRYLNSGYNYDDWQPKKQVTKYFVFTDRPLYRPGDKVNFKAILRDDDDARYSIPGGPVRVKIFDGYGEESVVWEQSVGVTAEGTVAGEYTLPDTANTGYYHLGISSADGSGGSAYFSVEFFRKPEYSIEVTAPQTELVAGDSLTFSVAGSYFSGQPIAHQKVSYRVYAGDFYEYDYISDRAAALDDDYRYGYWGGSTVTSGEVTLNQQGDASVTLETKKSEHEAKSQVYAIEASFEDQSGNPTFSRKNVLVYAGEYGIYRQGAGYYNHKVNAVLEMPLQLVSHRGSLVAGVQLTAKVHRQVWVSHQEKDQKYPTYRMEEEDLPELVAVTDGEGKLVFKFTPIRPGSYNFAVSGTDERGNTISKGFYAYVTDEDNPYYYFGGQDNDLTVRADKEKYVPGDIAQLTFTSTTPDRDVFLSMERGRVDRVYIVKMTGKTAKVEVPIEALDVPNMYAKASSFSNHALDDGEVKVVVSTDSKKLMVRVTPAQKTYGPSDQAVVNVETTDIGGNPVPAEVAVWAVDKAIFELRDNATGDVFDTFWQERYNGTQEAHSLEGIMVSNAERGGGCFAADTLVLMADGSQKQISEVKTGEMILTRENERKQSLVKAKVTNVHKREAAGYLIINDHLKVTANHKLYVNWGWREAGSVQIGDSFVDSEGKPVRVNSIEWMQGKFAVYNLGVNKYHTFFAGGVWVHNQKGDGRTVFKDTAYWNPSVHTDSAGRAQVAFKLPDNLTTWVVAGVGATTDTKVGQTANEIVVTKDVIVRPILPNILREGDEIVLSALVQNFTEEEQVFDIELKFDSGEIKTATYSAVPVKPKDMQQVYWEVLPRVVKDEAKLTFSAVSKTNKKTKDIITQKIPVRAFGFWEERAETGDGDKGFIVKLAADSHPQESEVRLSVSPTILGTLPVSMKYLVDYPYGCIEQTTSRFVPAVIAQSNPDLFADALEGKNVKDMIEKGLSRLAVHQQPDGGWAWWYSGGSDPFVSAYVVEYILMAEKLGITVDQGMLGQARNYFETTKMSNRSDEVAKSYALTLFGPNDKAEKIGDFDLSSDILALAVIANYRKGDANPETNGLTKLVSLAKAQGDGVFWEAGSKQHFASQDASTALAMRAILTTNADREMAVKGARFLTRNRRQNYWSNTFATAQVIRAIADLAKTGDELAPNYTYKVEIDGTLVDSGKVTSAKQKLKAIVIPAKHVKAEGSNVSLTKVGEGQLYSTLVVKEFHTDRQAQAVDHGLSVTREYVNAKGEEFTLAVGDTAIVKIKVSGLGAEDYYGVVTDELPAGLIPINQSFKNQQFGQDRKHYYSSYDVTDTEVTENGSVLSLYRVGTGSRTYTHKARVVSEGTFVVPPATASLMYSPEIYGRSGAQTLTITKESHVLPKKEAEQKTGGKVAWWRVVAAAGAVLLLGAGAGMYLVKRRRSSFKQEQ